MQPVRVVLLTSIMAPHREALFRALAADPRLDLTVIYLATSDPRRRWDRPPADLGYRYVVLRELAKIRRPNTYAHLTAGLMGALRASRPDVVIVGGWDQQAYLAAFVLRNHLSYRVLLWVENNLRDDRYERSRWTSVKRRLVAKADGTVVPGRASRAYVEALGARPDRLWTAPNAVDNERFREAAVDRSVSEGRPRFLFVGRFEPIKGVLSLLDAWTAVRVDAELAMVGAGPLEEPLHSRITATGLTSVHVLGHLQPAELVGEYAAADAFVLPSVAEPWGLVINEAMVSGLPIIASSVAGATDDLVTDGWNGFVVPRLDAAPLTRAIEALASDRNLRLAMGRRSAERIAEGFEPVHWATGMAEAVLAVEGRAG